MFSLAALTGRPSAEGTERGASADDESGLIDLQGLMRDGVRAPSPSAPAVTLGLYPVEEPPLPGPAQGPSRTGAGTGMTLWLLVGTLGAATLVMSALLVAQKPAPGAPASTAPPASSAPTILADPSPALTVEAEPAPAPRLAPRPSASPPAATSATVTTAPPPMKRPAPRPKRPTRHPAAKGNAKAPVAPTSTTPGEPVERTVKDACPCPPSDLLCAMRCATQKR